MLAKRWEINSTIATCTACGMQQSVKQSSMYINVCVYASVQFSYHSGAASPSQSDMAMHATLGSESNDVVHLGGRHLKWMRPAHTHMHYCSFWICYIYLQYNTYVCVNVAMCGCVWRQVGNAQNMVNFFTSVFVYIHYFRFHRQPFVCPTLPYHPPHSSLALWIVMRFIKPWKLEQH